MTCPNCPSNESKVVDSRHRKSGEIWRRRRCLKCGTTFSTYEVSEEVFKTLGLNNVNAVDLFEAMKAINRMDGDLSVLKQHMGKITKKSS